MDLDLHPSADPSPAACAVVLHPHPGMGGDRHHPLVVAIAEGLAGAGLPALRLDLPDPDLLAAAGALTTAAEELQAATGAAATVLLGYSWGSVVSSLARPSGLAARVLVAPPVAMLPSPVGSDGTPTLVLVPAHDQFGGPDAVTAAMGGLPGHDLEVVEGCDHFLAGAVGLIAARAVAFAAASVHG